MNDSKPKMNKKRTTFFIWRALLLEGFIISDTEHHTNPTSVTRTKGTNQKDTKLKIGGKGDKHTAKMKKAAAAKAAFFRQTLRREF